MSMMSEFKEFALKGNVMDLAVGVIIGGAFGKITTSLVEDIIMPIISAMRSCLSWRAALVAAARASAACSANRRAAMAPRITG